MKKRREFEPKEKSNKNLIKMLALPFTIFLALALFSCLSASVTADSAPIAGCIKISDAMHLDENRGFISNIYDAVKEKDGSWSEEIPENDYIRVTFEQELSDGNDITVYPRAVSGTPRIEVYEKDGTEIIAEFDSITGNEYNKAYLAGLDSPQETFDLKVIGGALELDHIIDPLLNVTVNFTSSGNWTAPAGVKWAIVEAWGGGGGGGGSSSNTNGGGGGGGGQYARKNVTVVPGQNYTVSVAAGGTAGGAAGGTGGAGGNTSFNGTLVRAVGGSGGVGNAGAGGLGNLTGSIGDVIYYGGNGTKGGTYGGGGGGGAGTTQSGGNASGTTGTPGTGGSLLGGNGGNGSQNAAGVNGNIYGGGGGGGERAGGNNRAGGAGAAGFLRITYQLDNTPPNVTLVSPPIGFSNETLSSFNVTFNCTVTDDFDLLNISLYITNSSNQGFSQNKTANITGTSAAANWTLELEIGNYTWNCLAYDTFGNLDWGNSNRTISIGALQTISPESNSPSDQNVDLGTSTKIEWTITDEDSANGTYYVQRNSSLFAGPAAWQNSTALIVYPNNYFLGTWAYTVYYNDSAGNNGAPDTVLVTVTDNSTPSCSQVQGASGTPILANITVDGDMSDWDPVLANPLNYMIDESSGAGDLDVVQTADRDLVEFAYTWNNQYIYMYFQRLYQGHNIVSVLAYIDYDLDGYMNSTDKVVKFVWSGSNSKYDSDLYNYVPSGTADLMNGSGYDMPGTITLNKSLETGVLGGTNPGISLETRVLWSDLGLSGPKPLNFQPASALSSGTNLPSQLEDNVDTVSTSYSNILFQEDQSKPAANGTSVYYDYDLMNCGNLQERIDFTNISSQGWNVTLYYPNGTIVTDTDSDGKPDIPLSPYNYTTLIVKIDIPGATPSGTVDVTTTTAISDIIPSYNKSVTATTSVGQITIVPYQEIIYGTAGMIANLNYTVYNYQAFNDTIKINYTSTQGWNSSILYANGSAVADTDSDGYPDLGNLLAGESKSILLRIYLPSGAAAGTNDLTTIRINSSANPSLSSNALANTTIKPRLILNPDYNRSVGIGDSTFYRLTVSQNWNATDVIDLRYTNVSNYNVRLFASDMITPLTDTDSDSIIDTGNLAGYGAEFTFYLRVTVPSNANEGDNEINVVYANSSLSPSVYDTSVINTTARTLIIYEDATRSNEETIFEVGDIVYARAHSLLQSQNVYFEWINPNATVIRTSADIPVSAEKKADDSLSTNISMLLGNWTVVLFDAQNDAELGRAIFYLLDLIPPNVTLHSPPANYYNETSPLNITFNCSTQDNYALANLSLYITNITNGSFSLNKTINISGRTNGTNWTLELVDGRYTWNCVAEDTSGNDGWATLNRTITIFTPVVSFTLTLPGESPVSSNKTQNGTTAVMFFNSSSNTNYDMNPCVKATGACQNSTVPFFEFQNTGNVNLSWSVSLNATLPQEITLQANSIYNGTNATNITTAKYNLSQNVSPSNISDTYFFADFVNAYPANSTNRTLTHEGARVI